MSDEIGVPLTEEEIRAKEERVIVELKNGFDSLTPVINKMCADLDTEDLAVRPHAIYMAASFLQNTSHFFKLLHESLAQQMNSTEEEAANEENE